MKHIPNLLTLANAICGMMAIYFIVNSSSTGLVIALLSAATFDALDGWAARKVGASSALGKQLDSLADAISFGAVSGFIWSSILADYARMPQPWAMLIGALVTPLAFTAWVFLTSKRMAIKISRECPHQQMHYLLWGFGAGWGNGKIGNGS